MSQKELNNQCNTLAVQLIEVKYMRDRDKSEIMNTAATVCTIFRCITVYRKLVTNSDLPLLAYAMDRGRVHVFTPPPHVLTMCRNTWWKIKFRDTVLLWLRKGDETTRSCLKFKSLRSRHSIQEFRTWTCLNF